VSLNTVCLAVALGPALLLLRLFQRLDAKRPEPPGSVRNVVLLGVASCLPAVLIELGLSAVLGEATKAGGRFLDAFLVAATTEESLKLACVLFYLWKKPHFDEVMDGILYTAAASLGFAMLENVLYAGGNLGIGLFRAFSAIPLHALASGLTGYFVGRAKLARRGAFGWVVVGLLVAIAVHGFYDWALMSEGGFGAGTGQIGLALAVNAVLLIACAFAMRLAVKHALSLDDALLGPHARPLPDAFGGPPSPPVARLPYVGMPVLVLWTDGATYPAQLLSGQGSHFYCALAGGRYEWVPRERVMAAPAY